MAKFIDLTGMKFGRLMVIKREANSNAGKVRFLCRCECEEEVTVESGNLNKGYTRSCGCLQKELLSSRSMTHGLTGDRLHNTWRGMRRRINNAKDKNYESYGGRGITICDEWDDFQNFYDWAMENRYSDELTIDRIDNDGDYCPENCRWSTSVEQARNRRSNRYIEYKGERLTVTEWAERLDTSANVIAYRLNAGWSVKKAISTPVQIQKKNNKKA